MTPTGTDGPASGEGRVRVSRVVYGWAASGLGHTTGAQYLGATEDLLDLVTVDRSPFDRHVGFLGDRTPARIDPDPHGRTVVGLDRIDGRWAVFRKSHPANVPDRHIVEFLVAPSGFDVDPALALHWAEHHAWITDTDRVNPLEPIDLPAVGLPEVHMLTAAERAAVASLVAILLADPTAEVHLKFAPSAAAQLLRAAFLVLPRSMAADITFSTLEPNGRTVQIAAAPFDLESSTSRVRLDPDHIEDQGPPELTALGVALVDRLERGDWARVSEIRELQATTWLQVAAVDRFLSGSLANGDLPLLVQAAGSSLVERVLAIETGADWVFSQVLLDRAAATVAVARAVREALRIQLRGADRAAEFEDALVSVLGHSLHHIDERLRAFLWIAADLIPPERRLERVMPRLGRGFGAKPEVRIDVLRFLFPDGQPEPTRVEHAEHWLLVPETELAVVLRTLTSEPGSLGIAPWVARNVLLNSLRSPVGRDVPVATLIPEFQDLVMSVAPVLGDDGFARWLVRGADERAASGLVDWLLTCRELRPGQLLELVRSPAMERSYVGIELLRRKDELLAALLRGSPLASQGERRRQGGWLDGWR